MPSLFDFRGPDDSGDFDFALLHSDLASEVRILMQTTRRAGREPGESEKSARIALHGAPRWDVASHTYRPPYYHRNAESELMGLIHGEYAGRSDSFQPGGVSFECGMVPHGVAYQEFKAASAQPPPEMRISDGAVGGSKLAR